MSTFSRATENGPALCELCVTRRLSCATLSRRSQELLFDILPGPAREYSAAKLRVQAFDGHYTTNGGDGELMAELELPVLW